MRDTIDHFRGVELGGSTIGGLLYYMKELGSPVEVAEVDKRKMLEELSRDRASGWGPGIAEMHYHMRNLGLCTTITEEDKLAMKRGLKEFRNHKEPDVGAWFLGNQLYHMDQLNLGGESQGQPMPPLKRFKG